MIGERVGSYVIESRLGGGGMGVVYRARDTDLERTVALKFLPAHLASDPEAKRRFLAEARAASTLDHPNICTIYQIGESPEGQLFIAMACYEGRTLQEEIRDGPLSIEKALDYASQIAKGLARAHEAGIVHRDVKPANVMITERGRVKILDFGLAKARERSLITKEGAVLGTVSYMSPEQVRGEAADHRTDLWSLGVVLYEMLTGRRPFDGDYDHAVMYAIANTDLTPLHEIRPNVPPGVESIVSRSLEKDPEARYGSAEEMLRELRLEAGDQTRRSFSQDTSRTSSRKTRQRLDDAPHRKLFRAATRTILASNAARRRGPVFLGAAGLAVLIALTFIFWSSNGSERFTSVAVLPLRSLSEDPEQQYFADGMTEALISRLSKISALERVISPQSVMRYADSDLSLSEIAAELGVDAIVRGSIQPAGSTVSIRVELSEGATDRMIWSEGYRREMRNVLELQDEVARAIVSEVQLNLTPEEEAVLTESREVDPEAYSLYVQGRHYWRQHRFHEADSVFKRATSIDPDFALPYSGLAENLLVWGHFGKYPTDAFPKAIEYAQMALERDPNLAEAHTALADSRYHWNWDWDAVERGFNQALSLNPSYETALWWSAGYLASMKRLDEAIARVARAQELNPVDPTVHAFMARLLHFAGRDEEAVEAARRSLEIYPTPFGTAELAKSYVQLGHHRQAIALFEKYFPHPTFLAGAAYAHAKADEAEKAREILARLEQRARRQRAARSTPVDQRTEAQTQLLSGPQVYPYYVSFAYAALGDIDGAFEKLDEAAAIRDASLIWVNVEPALEPIRRDPRYGALLERMDLPA